MQRHIDANVADAVYAVLGIRRKAYHKTQVQIVGVQLLSETVDDFEWMLYLNPVIAGSFIYVSENDSIAEVARGVTGNIITGGVLLRSGWCKSGTVAKANLESPIRLCNAAIHAHDALVLAVRPLSANADIQVSLMWREIV